MGQHHRRAASAQTTGATSHDRPAFADETARTRLTITREATVIDDLGGNTEDLTTYQQAVNRNSTDAEARTRRFGRRSLTAGIILIPLSYLFCLGAAVATNNNWGTADARIFAILGIFTVTIGGLGLTLIGGIEILQRPVRERQRLTSLAIDRNRILLERGIIDNTERFEQLFGLAVPVPGRLDAIEQRLDEMAVTIKAVPDYGRGVVDGMQVRNDSLGPERL
jgi:hypothetical protein